MLVDEYQRGWIDHDIFQVKNIGVHKGKLIKIDVGRYTHDKAFSSPKLFFPHLRRKCEKFSSFLHKRYPLLNDYLTEQLTALESLLDAS
jgi:hypothetical protein